MGKIRPRGDYMRIIFIFLLFPLILFHTNTANAETENNSLESQRILSFITGLQPDTPKQAVELWILGVKNRSGAVQYVLLSPSLQKQTRKQFEQRLWGTGQSSPWIDNVRIEKVKKISGGKIQYTIAYNLLTSNGNFGRGQKIITVEKNLEPFRKNWFITNITTKYNPYEAFTPAETVVKK